MYRPGLADRSSIPVTGKVAVLEWVVGVHHSVDLPAQIGDLPWLEGSRIAGNL